MAMPTRMSLDRPRRMLRLIARVFLPFAGAYLVRVALEPGEPSEPQVRGTVPLLRFVPSRDHSYGAMAWLFGSVATIVFQRRSSSPRRHSTSFHSRRSSCFPSLWGAPPE